MDLNCELVFVEAAQTWINGQRQRHSNVMCGTLNTLRWLTGDVYVINV